MDHKTPLFGIILIALMTCAQADRIALVIDFPGNVTYTECIEVTNGTDGYDTLNMAGVSLSWGGPHPIYGHSLCKINGIGNEPNAEGCEWGDKSWAYKIIKKGSYSWSDMPVGHDGGEDCWDRTPTSWSGHYCARDGDVIGYVWGSYDPNTWAAPDMRERLSFSEICSSSGAGKAVHITRIIDIDISPKELYAGGQLVIALEDNKTNKPVWGATVEIYDGLPGITSPILHNESDRDGVAQFTIEKPGEYTLWVSGADYPHEKRILNVTAATTTTTTTTSTSSTTTLPSHIRIEETTTTTVHETTTTSLEEPKITAAAVAQEPQRTEGGILAWIMSLFGL